MHNVNENELLGHLNVKVREAFSHEETEADGIIGRNEKGDFVIASDVFTLAGDSRDPEWGEHKFGLCTLHDGSVIRDNDEGAYMLDLVPSKRRKVKVVLKDENTGEYSEGYRWERTITVIATQVVPNLTIGQPVEQRDTGALSKLMRQRAVKAAKVEAAEARAEAKASGKSTRKKGRVVSGSLVTGSLVTETLDGKPCLFRIGGLPTPEAVFAATPEGFAERNAYLQEYKDAPPAPEASDEVSAASE